MAAIALSLASISSLVLLAIRALAVWQHGPLVYTSGREEEVMLSIWKGVHGQPIYGDPLAAPFTLSCYNWLFYSAYSLVARSIMSVAGLGDESLPLIARFTTLAFIPLSALIVFRLVRREHEQDLWKPVLISLLICCNPLVGYWALTARCDLGATFFELAGIYAFLRAEETGRRRLMWLALLLFYAAWAFKQSYVAGMAAACAYLFATQRRKLAVVFGGVASTLYGLTLLTGGPLFRYSLLRAQFVSTYEWTSLVRNFGVSIAKAPQYGLGVVIAFTAIRSGLAKDFLSITCWFALPIALAISGKSDTGDNFFIPVAIYASVLLFRAIDVSKSRIAILLVFAQFAGVIMVFGGVRGALRPAPATEMTLLRPALTAIGRPAFICDSRANLPWFNPQPPYLMLSGYYEDYRKLGKIPDAASVGGMITSGQVGVVVCVKSASCGIIDGVDMDRLPLIREDAYWRYHSTSQPLFRPMSAAKP